MKNTNLKKIICILLVFNSLIHVVSAAQKKKNLNFSLIYLFQKWNDENTDYSIYKGEELISDLGCLKNRTIFEIRLDRKNKDSVLFVEKKDNLCRIIRLNFLTNEETVLFEFEQDLDKYRNYRAFTENSLFYCNSRENNSKHHILYEYNSVTKQIVQLFEVDPGYIENVQTDDNLIYLYVNGGFDTDSGYYVIDRSIGEVRESKINLGWTSAGGRYNDKLIREGAKVKKYGNMEYWERDQKSCIVFDMVTFEETKCIFKKRYEAMGGPLILLSEDYFLVPLCIQPFKDSWNNGLFGYNWTVCYTVFDIKKNKEVFKGLISETYKMRIVDALLIN